MKTHILFLPETNSLHNDYFINNAKKVQRGRIVTGILSAETIVNNYIRLLGGKTDNPHSYKYVYDCLDRLGTLAECAYENIKNLIRLTRGDKEHAMIIVSGFDTSVIAKLSEMLMNNNNDVNTITTIVLTHETDYETSKNTVKDINHELYCDITILVEITGKESDYHHINSLISDIISGNPKPEYFNIVENFTPKFDDKLNERYLLADDIFHPEKTLQYALAHGYDVSFKELRSSVTGDIMWMYYNNGFTLEMTTEPVVANGLRLPDKPVLIFRNPQKQNKNQ